MALIHRSENKALFHVYDHFVLFSIKRMLFFLSQYYFTVSFQHKKPLFLHVHVLRFVFSILIY